MSWETIREVTTSWGPFVTSIAAIAGLIFAGIELKRSADQRRDDRNARTEERAEYRLSMARAFGLSVLRENDKMWITVLAVTPG